MVTARVVRFARVHRVVGARGLVGAGTGARSRRAGRAGGFGFDVLCPAGILIPIPILILQ
jgi:hypothetical protein